MAPLAGRNKTALLVVDGSQEPGVHQNSDGPSSSPGSISLLQTRLPQCQTRYPVTPILKNGDESILTDTILPSPCFVASRGEGELLHTGSSWSQCLPTRLCIPATLKSDVIQWAHASKFSCHPGIQRTRDVFQQRFWWATLEEDTREYVNACPTCNRNKSSRQPPSGLL